MPRYAIERQYLLPVFHHLIVEAESLDAACRAAVDNDDWPEHATKQDFDNSRPTTVAMAVVVDEQHRDEDPTWLLYSAGLPPCEIPAAYTDGERAENDELPTVDDRLAVAVALSERQSRLLSAIQEELSGTQWSADTAATIAQLLVDAGYSIEDPEGG